MPSTYQSVATLSPNKRNFQSEGCRTNTSINENAYHRPCGLIICLEHRYNYSLLLNIDLANGLDGPSCEQPSSHALEKETFGTEGMFQKLLPQRTPRALSNDIKLLCAIIIAIDASSRLSEVSAQTHATTGFV